MNSIGIQLRISDLLFAVQKRWKIIASLTFLGLVFGLLLSGMNYVQSAVNTYQVNGSFVINAVDSQGRYSGNSTAPNRTDITMATDLYDTVYYLLRSDRLLYQIINDRQMLGVTVGDIRNGLSISQYNQTNIITMRLTWENGEEGQEIWEAIIDTANKLLPQILQVGRLRIFNEPETTLISSRTANIKTWMVLPVLGFGAGMGFAILELPMRPTLINMKDVETVFGLETIGIIPYDSAYYANKTSLLVADEKNSSEVTQNFSAAAYILRNRIGLKEKSHCFYITSTTSQEGRTTVAANLAIQLSDMERHTLLIDFDYKNPMLGSMFLNNLDYNRSLNALYRGEIAVTEAITTLTGYLDILPMVMEHNLIYLDSTIVDMISQLREQYQYIIIDAPPVGKESETLSLNQVANTVLFVARYDTASIPEIQSSLEKLDKSGIRILGCIVNGVKSTKNVILGTSREESAKNGKAIAAKKKKALKKKRLIPIGKKEDVNESEDAVKDLTSRGKSTTKKKKKKSKTAAKPITKAATKITDFFANIPETPNEAMGVPSEPAKEPSDFSGLDAPALKPEAAKEPSDYSGMDTSMHKPEPEPKKEAPDLSGMDTSMHEPEPEPKKEAPDYSGMDTSMQEPEPQKKEAPDYSGMDTSMQEPEPKKEETSDSSGGDTSAQPAESSNASFDHSGMDFSVHEPELPQEASVPSAPEPAAPASELPVQSEDTVIEDLPALPAEGSVSEGEPSAEPMAEPPAEPPVEPPKAPEKKRGLFGRKPKEPAEPKKKEKAAAKKEVAAKKKPPEKEPKPAKPTKPPKEAKPAKEKKVKAEPVKEKKSGFLPWGKAKKEKPDPFANIKPEATVINKSRNVFDDLMDLGPMEPRVKTDEEITEELLRMGLDGSWDEPAKKDGSGDQPKSGKRNLFDDL